MFLATTALSEFWDKEQELLFLGSWCLPYDRRSEWEQLKYSVLPRPWDDRDLYYKTIHYLETRYEALVKDLGEYLNTVHGVSHGTRYWRILLGPWLRRYLHVIYDRYHHLAEAFRRHPGLDTYTLDPKEFRTSADTAEFTRSVRLDVYNLMIFSQVLQSMGYFFPTRSLLDGWPQPEGAAVVRANSWTRAAKRSGKKGLQLLEDSAVGLLGRSRPVALCDMYLPRTQVWSLAMRTRLRAIPLEFKSQRTFSMPGPSLDGSRNGLASLPADDEFGRVFVQSLPLNFPVIYLEAYQAARDETLRRHPETPRVLASLNGWYFNEPFKLFAAEASEKGSRLVASQHGGVYGTARSVPEEAHEASLSDTYLVWGWAEDRTQPRRNLPSPKLSKAAGLRPRSRASATDNTILVVTVTGPRYLLRFLSSPVGGQLEEYFGWEMRFLAATPQQLRPSIILRSLRVDYGWGLRNRISDRFPDIKWDDGRPYLRRLRRSRMAVIDNPATTFLEALVANVPTVLFWDPCRWEFRPEAEPYFDSLRRVGMLWDSPEDAAAKVSSVYEDPWQWWGSAEVQETRQRFVDRYALARKDWARQWARALKEELSLYEKSHG